MSPIGSILNTVVLLCQSVQLSEFQWLIVVYSLGANIGGSPLFVCSVLVSAVNHSFFRERSIASVLNRLHPLYVHLKKLPSGKRLRIPRWRKKVFEKSLSSQMRLLFLTPSLGLLDQVCVFICIWTVCTWDVYVPEYCDLLYVNVVELENDYKETMFQWFGFHFFSSLSQCF